MHLDRNTLTNLAVLAAVLIGTFVWIAAILLLIEVTRQLLDTLHYIVDLAQMS
jgi:hypothetical protein